MAERLTSVIALLLFIVLFIGSPVTALLSNSAAPMLMFVDETVLSRKNSQEIHEVPPAGLLKLVPIKLCHFLALTCYY